MDFRFERALAAGKALGPHPAFMDQHVPVSVYSPGQTPREDAAISQRTASRHAGAYGGDQPIDWVYDCVNLYADAISSASYRLEELDGTPLVRHKTDLTPPEYKVGPEDLYKLLDEPNNFMLYDELVSLLVIDLLLVGNAYWFKWRTGTAGKPLALYRLAPSHVEIVPGPYGPKHYKYKPPGARKPLKINPAEVIHFRRPNPHSAYYGMGVIQGGGRAMDLELAITDTQAHYFENRADPSLIIETERRLPRDVKNKLAAQLRSRVSGSSRAGEMLLLEAGLKATTLDRTAHDAMMDKLSTMSRDRIFTKFRTNPRLFGIMDQSGGGSDKLSDYRRDFDNSVLRPFIGRLSTQVSTALARVWGVKYVIEHRSYLPAEEAMKVGQTVATIPGVKIREVRKQFEQFGIPESTGDPEIDNFILNKPGPEMDANGNVVDPITGKVVPGDEINAADKSIGSEPGRPPKAENTKGFGSTSGKSLPDLLLDLEAKALASDGARVTVGNHLPDEQAPQDPFAAARSADINSSVAYITAGLRDATTDLERALLDHVEGKALKSSDLVARVRNSPAWKTFRERVEAVLSEGARRAAASGVMQSGLPADDDIDYDSIASSVIHRPEGLRKIVKTLRDRAVAKIRDARQANAERSEFEAAVREVIDTWSKNQAVTIAETEAVHAYNEATLTVAEANGLSTVYVTDGDDNDAPCQEANGQVWTIEHARENRLEHPNCRRAFLPLSTPAVV